MHDINNIIESLLFVAEEPLTIEKLKTVLETVEAKDIRAALQTLSDQYETRGGGFKLYEVAGGWQLRSRPEFNEWIKRMLQPSPQRLSKPALETLAIVAYNQPIIRADIEHIRGVDCGGVLRQLMERKLIRVLGRKEIPGRPLIYATTKLFLELFGLKDLKDLPSPKEIEEMATALDDTNPDQASPSDETQTTEGFQGSGHVRDLWDEDPSDSGEIPSHRIEAQSHCQTLSAESMPPMATRLYAASLFLQPRPHIGTPPDKIGGRQSGTPTTGKNKI